jgi:transcription elongation factor GreB
MLGWAFKVGGPMSKAFLKDDGTSNENFEVELDWVDFDPLIEDELQGSEAASGAPKNYITKHGYERLKHELDELFNLERPRLAESVARNNLESEKNLLREMDRRIRFLKRRTDMAEIVQPERQSGDRVLFGATVAVADEDENTHIYQVVGMDEADVKTGKVSWMSPVGHALLQARVGDFVSFHTLPMETRS